MINIYLFRQFYLVNILKIMYSNHDEDILFQMNLDIIDF